MRKVEKNGPARDHFFLPWCVVHTEGIFFLGQFCFLFVLGTIYSGAIFYGIVNSRVICFLSLRGQVFQTKLTLHEFERSLVALDIDIEVAGQDDRSFAVRLVIGNTFVCFWSIACARAWTTKRSPTELKIFGRRYEHTPQQSALSRVYCRRHQNHCANLSESRVVLRPSLVQRRNWPPPIAGPTPRTHRGRRQLKVMQHDYRPSQAMPL